MNSNKAERYYKHIKYRVCVVFLYSELECPSPQFAFYLQEF